MIENYLLEELVTFAKYKTLAATAQNLSVTQPTVTRGMQKLEAEFGVKLFNRQPNRLVLTKTGQLAAQEAEKILNQNQQMILTVRKFDNSQKVVKVASIAPGPMIVLNQLTLPKSVQLNNDFIHQNTIIDNLKQHNFSLIFTNQEIMTSEIESRYIGTEKLSVNLDKFTYLANQTSVTFKELQGTSFVVLTDIGVWKQIIQQEIPDAKFLYQNQVDSFTEITKYSNFPYFSTNLSKIDSTHQNDDDRVNLPISDEKAQMPFYASYLKEQRQLVQPIIRQLSASWL
ncbi:LysR family transcriptional regulator [Companilactobacillus nantensis]|uniref:LysR family transcriptional regulator n=1 Tax=Companilactobacillus nantensis DSM 16982 TaxID=1423774 RepID=A0A0R1WK39_9LACO|nr:LysR family transcriptional regulator [Companilactobacillus nantensis]KRM18274.1 LysR family transcriptional regulator [Companilactobacillus nantensis DSM 16982]GEO62939.1 LysR family transcriptional regulator [Companilactobacillus nantensis]